MNFPIIFALIFAVFEWVGEHKKNKRLIYITKPAVMISILVWIWLNIDLPGIIGHGNRYRLFWFIAALLFCLVGDIFLMFSERYFLPGLLFFLTGHIFYILGFGQLLPKTGNLIPGAILFVMILVTSLKVYIKISLGLERSGKSYMKIPVAAYAIIISVMLFSALVTLFDGSWHFSASLFVITGALSFYVSDILNAWTRYVEPMQGGRVKIMMTYHIAQISLAIGAVLHYVK